MIETECLSDLRLDELLVGEPVPASAHAHLASCAPCRARRATLAAERARFLAAPPPLPRPQPRPLARSTPARSRWLAGAGLAAGAAAAAFVLVLVFVVAVPERTGALDPSPHPDDPGETRTKGSAWLRLIVEHRGGQRTAEPGELVHPGDTLVYSISTPRPTYVAILGRDARGQVTAYLPLGSSAARFDAGADQIAPLATVLDESLGAEQVIAAFCEDEAPVAELIAALPAPRAGCKLDVLPIEKVR